MSIDPWQHMLFQTYPEYSQMSVSLDKNPAFVVSINKLEGHRVFRWRIRIAEHNDFFYHEVFDKGVQWATEQLSSWSNCKQMAWDMWDFEHRRDAEKFKTLFLLKWAQ